MADAVISFAIEKLGDFLVHQVNIRIGVRDDIRWLKEELGFLHASVKHAESREEEELIRLWISTVRDVANDAVDILRRFQDGQASLEQGHMHRFLNCICICKQEAQLYDIGNNIESVKKRIDVIKERRLEYGIDNILAGPDVKQKERTLIRTSAIDKQVDVVGFKEDIDKLMKQLNSQDPALKIISIHGMGGLGKTSLATKLYNSNELRHFGTRAKVCVSSDYTIKDVLKRIIKSFKGPEHEQYMSNMDEHDLLQYLPQLLQNQGCYLVLIDDIWDINAWNQIKIAFPNQDNGSRIIITTRNKKVAETVDKNVSAYQLRFLREEESWELFCKTAQPTDQNLENLGKEMVGKCGGLPLAIVILGGLLLHNQSYDYWSKVKVRIWRNLRDDSVDIVEILSLSYKDLSPQMKDCFLYLAQFPEDHIISVERLKHLWIAEEFISEDEEGDGVVMEDLAEDCLNELINRNLIQIQSLLLNGKVGTCRVHDLVRELAIKKAEEQKLLVIFDSSKDQPNLIHLLEGQRRHAISNGIGECLKLLEQRRFDASYLRSLLFEVYEVKVYLKEVKLMHTRFKNLKVLDMSSVRSDWIPEEIGDLVLLKFLGLTSHGSKTVAVPASIGKLKKLQSLWGGRDGSYYTVPRELWELPELRHLYYLFIEISGRLNIGSHQTKLHSLIGIQMREWVKIDTVNFTNLRTLHILNNDHVDEHGGYSLESLSSLNLLKSVYLVGIIKHSLELRFLPDSVMDLTLYYSDLKDDPMPSLENLPNLTTLELDRNVYRGNKMVCSQNAFPSLQILRLSRFDYLKELQVKDGAFPCLKSFQALYCEKLKKIPVQLERFLTEPGKSGMDDSSVILKVLFRYW
ncbi:hypothetical protein ACET3Z_030190 [Daucus carota]